MALTVTGQATIFNQVLYIAVHVSDESGAPVLGLGEGNFTVVGLAPDTFVGKYGFTSLNDQSQNPDLGEQGKGWYVLLRNDHIQASAKGTGDQLLLVTVTHSEVEGGIESVAAGVPADSGQTLVSAVIRRTA